ncbi:putative extracellular nuclease [Beggiatoa alba B18LD]|uniref:Putative extracellular nuclease n=1 Tax=Beggiatoa alba B18LD TaxID=395493 RepID=I3CBX8_9GAMM|nr:ExeM/NucH family extracellular endonuclease [Beggiatoa alba]EIJ41121.1 putative extracellular nuclease [Beggiatoa alba B18LD]
MLQKLTIWRFLFFLWGFIPLSSQATLTAGDIAIIGFNTNTSPDNLAILFLTDVPAGEIFFIVDNEVTTADGTTFADYNEAEYTFTAISAIAKGTVIVLGFGSGQDVSNATYSYASSGGTPGLGNGEEIYIYQTSTNVYNTGTSTFIFGISQGGNTGLRPSGLIDNQTWIDFGSDRAYQYKPTGAVYSGDKNALLTAIGNTSNYNASTSSITLNNSDYSFSIGSSLPTVTLSLSASTGDETTATVITLTATASSAVSGDQTLDISVTGTGVTASDYTLSSATMTILSGQTTGTVTFTIVDDTDVEGTETATLTLSNPSAGISLGSPVSQAVTITDNDSTGIMRITEYMRGGGNGEFIEFTNVGTAAIDMTGWSFDDSSQVAGSFSLSAFGTVAAGESVILTESAEATFRSAWNLCAGVKIIGGLTQNLGGSDEINLYDSSNVLVDRLTYINTLFDANTTSAYVTNAGVGANDQSLWTLSVISDGENSYASSGGDKGSPSTSTRATVSYDPCPATPANAPTITLDTATTSNYLDANASSLTSPFTATGTVGTTDSTDPMRTLGLNFTIADLDTPIANVTVSAVSSNTSVVPNANMTLTGSGTTAVSLKIQAAAVGYADITLTADDGTYQTTFIIQYAASSAGMSTSRYHSGKADASTAIALDSNYMLVADDEDQTIRLYDRQNSGLPLNSFDFTSSLNLTDLSGGVPREVDIEASTRNGNDIYWLASHSHSSGGSVRPNRYRLIRTALSGSASSSTLAYTSHYEDLRADLISWGDTNSYGFTTSAATGKIPELIDGFNIEGFSLAPDGTTALIGFRAPQVPTSGRVKALIAPINNFTTWASSDFTGSPSLGTPIELDLGGRGIRSLECNSDGCLIIAGASDASGNFKLYRWSGNAGDAPIAMTTNLSSGAITGGGNDGSFESIVALPTGAMTTWAGQTIQLLLDNGDTVYYNDATIAKELSNANQKKFRSEIVTLSEPATIAKIHTIQGTGSSVVDTSSTFIVEGIVTADYQSTTLKGFFIQEEDSDNDADPNTSEGIFVYCNTCPDVVSVGDKVQVTGKASEYFNMSQLSATTAGSSVIVSTGNVLPAITTITLPIANTFASKDAYLEPFEGMRVKIAGTLSVAENYQLGRFNEIVLISGSRPSQYTHLNAPSTTGYATHIDSLDRASIVLDDETDAQNPDPVIYPQGNLSASNTLRSGSTIDNLTGILHWSWGGNSTSSPNTWRIRPITGQSYDFNLATRPSNPPSVGSANIKVASFNLLNYFNTFTNCSLGIGGATSTSNCRGAENSTEFTRQKNKHKQVFVGLDADVIGLMELENDGYGSSSAQQDLLDLINSAGLTGRNYVMIDADAAIGVSNALGTDAIKIGFIYDDNALDLVAGSVKTSSDAIFDRHPLAATFTHTATGEKFTVVVNHLKSKSSAGSLTGDTDQYDGQGMSNATRVAQAQALVTFLNTLTDDSDILVIGDMNAYRMEDPITVIKNAGYTDLLGSSKYSYVYDGQIGYLDHALASSSLVAQITGADDWHINSDEPSILDYNTNYKTAGQISSYYNADAYRASDHDPVLIGLNLVPRYQLNLAVAGSGSVNSSGTPTGESCGTNCLSYLATTTVTLTATPNSGYYLTGWSCTPSFTTGNVLTANTTCTATFTPKPTTPITYYNLTVQTDGTGAGVLSGNSSGSYASGTAISLNATANADSVFTGWTPNTCANPFLLSGNMTCTATFELITPPPQYSLSLATTGTGTGTISGNSAGTYPNGTLITLSALANTDSHFIGWTPASCATAFTLTANTTCTAQFELNPITPPPTGTNYSLSLATTGTGIGTINGNSAGTYPSGTLINLSVTTEAGSQFIGWTPANCANPFTLTANTTCTAQFERLPPATYTLTLTPSPFGTVILSNNVQCPDTCQVTAEMGSMLQLNPVAQTGYQFMNWAGDNTCAHSVTLNSNLHCEPVFLPITPSNNSGSNSPECPIIGDVNTLCNAQNRETTDPLTVLAQGNISNLIVTIAITNHGWLGNLWIKPTGQITGGVLTGYIRNQGTLTDIDFKGGLLQGGILAGTIINSSQVGGIIADVRFMNNATLTGGILQGRIYGNPNAPVILSNVRIKAGSHLSGVILGDNVTLEDDVVIDNNITLPLLENISAYDATGKLLNLIHQFAGGISVNNTAFTAKTSQKLADKVTIRGRIFVAPEHIGQTADIFIYAPYWYADERFIGYFMADSLGQILSWDEKPLNLTPFKAQVILEPVQELTLYTGKFVEIGTLKIVFGYRLTDGTIVLHHDPSTIHVDIQP